MNPILNVVKYELKLFFRQGSENAIVVAFFILAVILFPLGVGPDPNKLSNISPGIIWVSALLASMLSLERLFQNDFEDGSLEIMVLQPTDLEFIVLAKVFVHWLTTGVPILIVTPVLAILVNLPENGFWTLLISLIIGTPSLSLIGGIGAALIVGSKRGGILLSLLILPLYIPILIFGVNSVNAAIGVFSIQPHLLMLVAIFLVAVILCPWVSAAAIRQAMTN